eukprot:CAMPEP_0116055358 /NCGR_PEP_ID=MMETSP0322-20121206/3358_1 /TAXON_ID=163516 /ORGANISM="Leptocylindrus danicus var. apora, Strain B651" /LENGTH=558 /DNA_ID=CAMNT_0003538943 /DNA_START=232 /DNA_END=1908 /DNA_ORIENTATION=+
MSKKNRSFSLNVKIMLFLFVTASYALFMYRSGGASSYLGSSTTSILKASMADTSTLSIATWNVAAINNNPFEYWITIDGHAEYEKLMKDIEFFLENPGDKDILVKEVFTEEMFSKLDSRMTEVGWESVRSYWKDQFQDRKIISGFMKDPLLGSKRLASMPDRITNTINVVGSSEPVCRPTVINMYAGDLSTLSKWWDAWEKFMFDTPLKIDYKGVEKTSPVYKLLKPISQAKYPAITDDEEKVSLPLQTMCGAIFDAILVHMMNTVSKPGEWQPLKKTMVEALNKKKVPNTLKILESTYSSSDIITLQEVSSALIDLARNSKTGKNYHVVAPADLDATRDQNSVILLNKKKFPTLDGMREISSNVSASFPKDVKVPVASGDILAIAAEDKDSKKYVIASFHGDTNGLATIPVLDAIKKAMASEPDLSSRDLIFGLDANTYEKSEPGKTQDVMEWGKSYVSHDLTSCWGDIPDAKNYTTYNARTYLQPQLNKACKSDQKKEKGDINPKDFILFPKASYEVERTWKDNTGEMKYIEDMAFPTLTFPSDHGILATILKPKA